MTSWSPRNSFAKRTCIYAKLVGRGEDEDEVVEGLVPSYGEEAEHHTDGHDLKLLPVCFW